MDFLLDILFELYLELMMFVVPEKNTTSHKYRWIAMVAAFTVLLVVLALFAWGGILLYDYGNTLGVIPIILAAVISIAQIIAGIVIYHKRHKN